MKRTVKNNGEFVGDFDNFFDAIEFCMENRHVIKRPDGTSELRTGVEIIPTEGGKAFTGSALV